MIEGLWHIAVAMGWALLLVFTVAIIMALARAELVRFITEVTSHHYKLKTEFLEKFEEKANRPGARRTGSSYN
jgi:hypothetical protein